MWYETRFSKQDIVYFMHGNKIVKSKILEVHLADKWIDPPPLVNYVVQFQDSYINVRESDLYLNKEDLMADLLKVEPEIGGWDAQDK